MNDSMGVYVAEQTIKLMLKKSIQVLNSHILVLGFSFKENCPDCRNTKVVDIVRTLRDFHANVTVYDPWVNPSTAQQEYGIDVLNTLPLGQYDGAILAVAHESFMSMDILSLLHEKHVIYDAKSCLPHSIVDGRL